MAIVSLKPNPFQNSPLLPTALSCFKLQNKYINKAKSLQVWGPSCQSQGTLHAKTVPQAVWALKSTLNITWTISNHKTCTDQPCQEEYLLLLTLPEDSGLLCICQVRTLRMLKKEGNTWGAAVVVWKGSLSHTLEDFLQSFMSSWRALQGSSHCACTAQINSFFVHRFFFQADVQIFPTWVQSHDVLHQDFLKACRDPLEAPQWSHYCHSASVSSLAARMVLKIYITVMGHEQIWLENIITFPKGLHTVIQKCMAKLFL